MVDPGDVPRILSDAAHERLDEQDLDHMRRILAEFPLSMERLDELAAESPYVLGSIADPLRVASFQAGLTALRRKVSAE